MNKNKGFDLDSFFNGAIKGASKLYKATKEKINNFDQNHPDMFSNIISSLANSLSNTCDSKLHYDVLLNKPKLLIKHLISGEDPDIQRETDGITPLHLASFMGKKDLVEILLKNSADPNILSFEGSFTALHAAVECENQATGIEVARILFRYGVRADLQNEEGDTAYQYAIKSNKLQIAKFIEEATNSKAEFDGYHKFIKSAELPGADLVELRYALNNNDFDAVYKIVDKTSLDYHDVADWAKFHSYEDKVGAIIGMCENTHHDEL